MLAHTNLYARVQAHTLPLPPRRQELLRRLPTLERALATTRALTQQGHAPHSRAHTQTHTHTQTGAFQAAGHSGSCNRTTRPGGNSPPPATPAQTDGGLWYMWVVAVYGVSGASRKQAEAFYDALRKHMTSLSTDGTPFFLAGDFQAVPPTWSV